jgi:hypothetical protein
VLLAQETLILHLLAHKATRDADLLAAHNDLQQSECKRVWQHPRELKRLTPSGSNQGLLLLIQQLLLQWVTAAAVAVGAASTLAGLRSCKTPDPKAMNPSDTCCHPTIAAGLTI